MNLRPISFFVPSSTEIKIYFSLDLSESLTSDNFYIESISGSGSDLEIVSISIDSNLVTIKTRPQAPNNYYLLKLLDTTSQNFVSSKGISLINDSVSREIFFLGIENVNRIRDDMLSKLPQIYNIEGTKIYNIISNIAEEILDTQHDIGSLLNSNYLKIPVIEESRTRGSGAYDRLANENAYEVTSVSKFRSSTNSFDEEIFIESSDIYPFNLRQTFIESEEISLDSKNNSFFGFLLNLSKKYILKVSSIKVIKSTDLEDCSGNIGKYYNIEKYKYSINNNRYDQNNAFSSFELETNQVLLSDFGNISRLEPKDKVIISYYYEDKTKNIDINSLSVFSKVSIINESVPSNSTNFYLKNSPIINSSGETSTSGGVLFKINENSDVSPDEFQKELEFNFSKLPKNLGEYTINYETGEVILVGSEESGVGLGTGFNYYYCNYTFKKEYKKDLDFFVYNNEINFKSNRPVIGKNIYIQYTYNKIYSEGEDYIPCVHKESMSEAVENKYTSTFSFKTKNSPITDVFRVLNQTTGEVYSVLYYNDNEVFISGRSLPRFQSKVDEPANFEIISNEELVAAGELISPMHYATVTGNDSVNAITIYPPIPSEFIDSNSTYFVRVNENDGNLTSTDDKKVAYFHPIDSNGNVSSFAISNEDVVPSIGQKVTIGIKTYVFNLKNSLILNKENDAIGSITSSSISFSQENFINEKYFEKINSNSTVSDTTAGSIYFTVENEDTDILYQNLSKIRAAGDYTVDYFNGVIYLGVNSNESYYNGEVSYLHSSHISLNKNILSADFVSKRLKLLDQKNLSPKIYESFSKTNSQIKILDLEQSLNVYDGSLAVNTYNEEKESFIVLDDYTALTPIKIKSINAINTIYDLYGENLNSKYLYNRSLEKTKNQLLATIADGGVNYFDSKYVTFNNNIIDFKKLYKTNLNTNISTNTIYIKDDLAASLYNIIDSNTNNEIVDKNYNILIEDNIIVNSIEENIANYLTVYYNSINSEYILQSGFDYILDSSLNRYKIIEQNNVDEYFVVEKYAENNLEVSFSDELFSLVSRPIVNVENKIITIIIPINIITKNYSSIKIQYITSYTPEVGTALCIDYHIGSIYFDYTYIADDLYVWYEHGDNQLDWSINNSINEGDTYYVTYSYGALRNALRKNFGSITNISKLNNFSLNVDRETYRDFLIGVLQSFPKGPTLPSVSNLVSSVTKTEPEINESFFGNWILGRDYLKTSTVNYSGNLFFEEAKFKQGLNILDENVISIPAISNLSLNEGTIETWIKPNWNGINNDASLTFSFDNVGRNIYTYIGGEDPFSSKYKFEVSSNISSGNYGTDFTGGSLTIFKNINENDGYSENDKDGSFSIYHNKSSINRLLKTNLSLDIKQNYLNLGYLVPYLDLHENNFLGGSYVNIGDSYKDLFIIFGYKSFKDSPTIFYDADIAVDTIFDFSFPYKTKLCQCSSIDQRVVLSNFENLEFEITFVENIQKQDIIYSEHLSNESPEMLSIVDQNGYIYQVKYVVDANGVKITKNIPNNISKIVVSRFPENYKSLSGMSYDDINNVTISSFLILNKVIKLRNKFDPTTDSSYLVYGSPDFISLNWSKFNKLTLSRDSINNIVSISLPSVKYNYFYTDLLECSDVHDKLFPFTPDDKISVGVINISSLDFKNFRLEVDNKFNLNDIYIGLYGYHPARQSFNLNRFDDKHNNIGVSHLVDTKEGIFIGYDSDCISPVDKSVGQWVMKVRNNKFASLPVSVTIVGSSFENIYDLFEIKNPVSGLIKTDGEFSSVSRGRRLLSGDCGSDSNNCSGMYRYCAESALENGWIKYGDTSSDIINSYGGRQQEIAPWLSVGTFETSLESKSYRIYNFEESSDEKIPYFGYGLLTEHLCNAGNNRVITNIKINQFDLNIINYNFNKITSTFFYTGISPLVYSSDDLYFAVCYAVDSFGQGIITLVDLTTLEEKSSIAYNWDDSNYHSILCEINNEEQIIKVFIDESLYIIAETSSFNKNNVEKCNLSTNNFIGILGINEVVVDGISLIKNLVSPNIDLNLIELSYHYDDGKLKLEDDDIFIQENDSSISFSLVGGVYEDLIQVDGYAELSDLDEIFITSDKPRYIVDSGINNSHSRFSLFKDGKGFLNFRIYDRKLGEENTIFNLATSIKHFIAGDLHHIGVSWKANSYNESDEMHLFIDGEEAPNIYKFGGKIPLKINAKFADISQETLQDHLVKNIIYYDNFENCSIIAGDNKIYSEFISENESLISRGILIKDSSLADSLVGNYYTIIGVKDGYFELGDPNTFSPVIFDVSSNDISFCFPPSSGEIYQIKTDIYNDRFAIRLVDCNQNKSEIGGVEVGIVDGSVFISPGLISDSSFRYNSTLRIIEFIKYDQNLCKWFESVNKTDLNVSIITFGLKSRRVNQIIQLSSSSLHTSINNDLSFYLNKTDEISLIQTIGSKPRDLLDVFITKIIMKDILISESYIDEDTNISEFEIQNNQEIGLVTSDFISKEKNNDGRYLSVLFDSDNIKFCGNDGYSEENNYLDIYGENSSSEIFERIFINGNGRFSTENRFYEVTKIVGKFDILDASYEVCKFSIEEENPITIQDGDGDYAKIERYVDGYFLIGFGNSDEYDAFELTPGYYRLEYPSSLKIDLPMVGDQLYIGSSMNLNSQLNGTIDDFVVRNEMLLDLKPYEESNSSVNTITYNFNKNYEACLSSNVLCLINFNNPIDYQARALRNYKFLDETTNISYNLDINERETLIKFINNKSKFISQMINMGYKEDEAVKLYTFSHMAGGGPIKNIAEFYPLFSEVSTSGSSVNDFFGSSGKFIDNKITLFNNNSTLRNNGGQIEFWISPTIDTKYDFNNRYFFDAYSAQRVSVKSTASNKILLNNSASKILSIKLLKNTQEFSGLIPSPQSEVLFDEITRSEISGMLEGGTGVEKDFSLGAIISPDGKTITLKDVLPGSKIDVVVTYIPKQFSGQRISIFKDRYSRIVFRIISKDKEYFTIKDIDWDSGSWHRISCSYSCNSKSDFIRIIVDGVSSEDVYSRESTLNQDIDYDISSLSLVSKLKINLDEQFSQLVIGNNLFDDCSAKARIDNFRISKDYRKITRDSSGQILDPNYSSNLNSIYPVKNDDLTTFIVDFENYNNQLDFFATIIDQVNGIYSFDIDIFDDFNKIIGIDDGRIEDLMVELINRIKPAHTNCVVNFKEKYCKN